MILKKKEEKNFEIFFWNWKKNHKKFQGTEDQIKHHFRDFDLPDVFFFVNIIEEKKSHLSEF